MALRYKDSDGKTHFRAPHVADYLLCGYAMDGKNFDSTVKETKDKVDCPACIDVVEFCRDIRSAEIK